MLEVGDEFDWKTVSFNLQPIINETIQNDLIIQAGRESSLPTASRIQLISVRALQRARNRYESDEIEKQKEKMK
jgi:hypothetical protein